MTGEDTMVHCNQIKFSLEKGSKLASVEKGLHWKFYFDTSGLHREGSYENFTRLKPKSTFGKFVVKLEFMAY